MKSGRMLGPWFFLLLVVFMVLGAFLFGSCYSEHRDMGFSVISSFTSCSG